MNVYAISSFTQLSTNTIWFNFSHPTAPADEVALLLAQLPSMAEIERADDGRCHAANWNHPGSHIVSILPIILTCFKTGMRSWQMLCQCRKAQAASAMSTWRPSACKAAWTTRRTHLRRRILFVLDPWTLVPNTESFHCKLQTEHGKNGKKRPARSDFHHELQFSSRFHNKTSTFLFVCLRCLNLFFKGTSMASGSADGPGSADSCSLRTCCSLRGRQGRDWGCIAMRHYETLRPWVICFCLECIHDRLVICMYIYIYMYIYMWLYIYVSSITRTSQLNMDFGSEWCFLELMFCSASWCDWLRFSRLLSVRSPDISGLAQLEFFLAEQNWSIGVYCV